MMKNITTLCFAFTAACCLFLGCQQDTVPQKTVNPKSNASTSKKSEDQSGDAPSTDSADDVASTGSLENPKFTQTIPETLVEFEMILVPGDEAKGVKPFYIGKQEVSWDEFGYWALCEDMSLKKAIEIREKKLRPSPPHDTEGIYRGWGRKDQPAVGMSRLAAELYCQWLSEQTGRKYRLPTATEWEHALISGGVDLEDSLDAATLDESAWFAGNSLDDSGFDNRAMPLASKSPNSLGVYDLLGNAAEWVTDTGDDLIVRGGSFLSESDELTGAVYEVEDQAKWNKDYPREPKSIWWYVNADYVGFRLVCEGE